MGHNNCNERDTCLYGGHQSGSEEGVVCSEFAGGGGGKISQYRGSLVWVLEDE